MSRFFLATLALVSVTLVGCSSSSEPTDPTTSQTPTTQTPASSSSASASSEPSEPAPNTDLIVKGQAVYAQALGGSRFACADCHALEEDANGFDAEGFRRPGHPIGDATGRPHFKNTQLTAFVDAANSCLDEWMGTTITWNNNSDDLLALTAFLDASPSSTQSSPALSYTIKPADVPAEQGRVEEGRLTFNKTCAICHGENAVLDGNPRGIDIRYISTSATDVAAVARKVRRSGDRESGVYEGLVGGIMPFWSAERMSDQELADITAFLGAAELNSTPTTPDNTTPDSTTPPSASCGSTSPRIGQTASLRELQHDVSGTAEIVDDCTIIVRNFNYDGQGVDVEFYAAPALGEFARNGGNYYSITPGRNFLRQSRPYMNEEITITLPQGTNLDDLGAISLWCVDFDIDFGSGSFQ